MVFQLKLLEKACFIARKSDPANQFWLLESALRLPCIINPLISLRSNLWNHSNTTGIDFHQSKSWKVAVVAGALYINWLTEINFQVILISEFEK